MPILCSLASSTVLERKTQKAALLTTQNQEQCLIWARDIINWTLRGWPRVWFNESQFHLFRADGKFPVCFRPYEAMDTLYQQGTMKTDGGSIMA